MSTPSGMRNRIFADILYVAYDCFVLSCPAAPLMSEATINPTATLAFVELNSRRDSRRDDGTNTR